MAGGKMKISITVSQDTLDWVDDLVESGNFRNRSHGFEQAVRIAREAHRQAWERLLDAAKKGIKIPDDFEAGVSDTIFIDEGLQKAIKEYMDLGTAKSKNMEEFMNRFLKILLTRGREEKLKMLEEEAKAKLEEKAEN
jgi:Arc/MetJ-type ribon-helix-helix transcriptional regulator